MNTEMLKTESLSNAKETLENKILIITESNGLPKVCFNVKSVSVDQDTQKVCVYGKEMTVENNILTTVRCHYPIHEDYSFGKWSVDNITSNSSDASFKNAMKETFNNINAFDVKFNDCDFDEFFC